MGAGRTELLETIFGVHPRTSGELFLHGKKVEIRQPADAIRHGLSLLTEDRKLTGLYLNATVRDNISIANLLRYLAGPFVRFRRVAADCERMRRPCASRPPACCSGSATSPAATSRRCCWPAGSSPSRRS